MGGSGKVGHELFDDDGYNGQRRVIITVWGGSDFLTCNNPKCQLLGPIFDICPLLWDDQAHEEDSDIQDHTLLYP